MNNLHTPWFENAKKDVPLNDYPTPQLQREDWLCLNGEYDYAITPLQENIPAEFDGKILVPFAIESELSGVQKALSENENLWYRKKVTLPAYFKGKRTVLHFQAVDYKATVFINGKKAGEHTGGYNPFSFDITDLIGADEFEMVVKVFDPTDKSGQTRGKQVQRPFGFWYTATSGIWQTVWCEPVNENRIEKIAYTPDIDASTINIKTQVKGSGELYLKISEEGKEIFSSRISDNENIELSSQRLWSPESPFLYDVELSLINGGAVTDKVKSYFGMRKFSVMRDEKGVNRLSLNNKPYFHRGLLDQGYWPESGLTAPTDEALIFDIEKMKELGFNMLRKHIKVESARWYYHCDRLGMLVWQDMPSGAKALNLILAGALPNINVHIKDSHYALFSRKDEKFRQEFLTELDEMLDNLYNCVSLCTWVPFNEGWGQFDAKETSEHIKEKDPTRFVDHASGWHDQKGADFKSIHKYVLPVNAPTKHRTLDRPVVLSEYGGYQNSVEGHTWSSEKSFGLYLKFKDKASLSKHYEALHEKQIIPLIKRCLCATVYTQVSDVENELNGIYTYDRKKLKINEETVKNINKKLCY